MEMSISFQLLRRWVRCQCAGYCGDVFYSLHQFVMIALSFCRQDRCVNQGDVDGIQPYHRAFEYDQPLHASAKQVNIRQGISYSSDNEILHATLV